jgi:hypothetical protein
VTDCLCGRDNPKQVGQPVERGDILGFTIEAGMRYGRVVGRIKPDVKLESLGAARVIVREFRPGDGRWPTGGYSRSWLLVPWDHEHPTTELTEYQEPVDWKEGPFR